MLKYLLPGLLQSKFKSLYVLSTSEIRNYGIVYRVSCILCPVSCVLCPGESVVRWFGGLALDKLDDAYAWYACVEFASIQGPYVGRHFSSALRQPQRILPQVGTRSPNSSSLKNPRCYLPRLLLISLPGCRLPGGHTAYVSSWTAYGCLWRPLLDCLPCRRPQKLRVGRMPVVIPVVIDRYIGIACMQ